MKPVLFPVRWNQGKNIPSTGHGVRKFVVEAKQRILSIDPLALDILATVSGRFLTNTQRQVLTAVAHEFITDDGWVPPQSGGLSQVDIFGAVFGLAQFALMNPADWLFVRIPEGSTKSPDIYAVSGRSHPPWNLEVSQWRSCPTSRKHGGSTVAKSLQSEKENTEAPPAKSGGNPREPVDPILASDLLAAVAAGNAGMWADSKELVDEALVAFADRSTYLRDRIQPEFLLERLMAEYWPVSSESGREAAVGRLRAALDRPLANEDAIGREIERPEPARRPLKPEKSRILDDRGMPTRDVEHSISTDSFVGKGVWVGNRFRVAPKLELVDRALHQGHPRLLMEEAEKALQDIVRERQKRLSSKPPLLELQNVSISSGDKQWLAGKRLTLPDQDESAWVSFDGRIQLPDIPNE
ncbi:hypothetical protein ACN28S_55825 [Cystobacter fuscus]